MPNDNLWRLLGLCILAFKVVWSAPAHGDASSASEVVSKNEQDITEGLISHYQSLNRGSEPPSLLPGSGLRLGSNVRTNGKGRAELSAVPNKHELIYTMPTMVGDKTLMLIFDTGSSDTYVLGSEVPSHKSRGRTKFITKLFRRIPGRTFQLFYQGGDNATGYVGVSPIGIGSISLPDQVVNVATEVGFPQVSDGVIGTSVGRLISEGEQPQSNQFLDNLVRSLEQPVFAANLRSGAPSTYQFGFFDMEKFNRGRHVVVKVDDPQGRWQFLSDGAVIGGKRIVEKMPTLVDTGSSMLRMRKKVVDAYYDLVPGSFTDQEDRLVFPCDARLPDLSILIRDYVAVIPGALIRGPNVSGTNCLGGLQLEIDNVQSFGVVFLKSQYTVFDKANLYLGFAPHE